jgi:hypothetical protein
MQASSARRLGRHARALCHPAPAAGGALPSTMRALIKEGDTVSVQVVPVPVCKGEDLLVRVEAAALNPTDLANLGLMGPAQARAIRGRRGHSAPLRSILYGESL